MAVFIKKSSSKDKRGDKPFLLIVNIKFSYLPNKKIIQKSDPLTN